MSAVDEKTWKAETPTSRQSLTLTKDGIELYLKAGGTKSRKSFAFDEIESFGYSGNLETVKFRCKGKLLRSSFEAGSMEDRDEIIRAIREKLDDRCIERIENNSFLHCLKEFGIVFVPFAALCGGILTLLLLTTEAPVAGEIGGGKGGRIVRGLSSLAHAMGVTGILIFVAIVAVAWITMTTFASRKAFTIHTFELE